ncbi:hypothetical protein [Sphingobacterium kyonggiense]
MRYSILFLLFAVLVFSSCQQSKAQTENVLDSVIFHTPISYGEINTEPQFFNYHLIYKGDTTSYPYNISSMGIKWRYLIKPANSQTTLKHLSEILPYYVKQFPKLVSFNFIPSNDYISNFPYIVNRQGLQDSINTMDPKRRKITNYLAAQLLLNSNLIQQLNQILEPYGFRVQGVSTEKVGFDIKGLMDSLKTNKDSFEFKNKIFIGSTYIKIGEK